MSSKEQELESLKALSDIFDELLEDGATPELVDAWNILKEASLQKINSK